ncbi:MAG: IclR family transcriptional regulator [Deltaproteobacteria bacterium]|nr:IclR family transcriptional regulator [Deltaproteobacteria bacterium]
MVKSATRVMQILELVGQTKDGMKHQDISSALKIPKGSLSPILADLVSNDFLTLGEYDKRYRIGYKILVLAGRYVADFDIIKASQPFIRNVIAETNESCGLAVITGQKVTIVWREETREPLKWDFKIGDQNPIYSSAHGKAILAFYSQDEIDKYLSSVELVRITEKTITDKEAIKSDLERVRENGIAFSREENFIGITSIAVPVFNNLKQVVGSLGSPVPSQRLSPEKEKLISKALKDAAGQLSKELGYFK